MNNRQNLAQLAIYGVIALVAVAGAIILGLNDKLNSDAVAAILTGALALAGGSAASIGAVYTATNGKSVLSPQLVAEEGANHRTAIIAAAAGSASEVTPVTPAPTPEET